MRHLIQSLFSIVDAFNRCLISYFSVVSGRSNLCPKNHIFWGWLFCHIMSLPLANSVVGKLQFARGRILHSGSVQLKHKVYPIVTGLVGTCIPQCRHVCERWFTVWACAKRATLRLACRLVTVTSCVRYLFPANIQLLHKHPSCWCGQLVIYNKHHWTMVKATPAKNTLSPGMPTLYWRIRNPTAVE